MDTIKILLGVTVALLLGALAVSWMNFQKDQKGEPADKLAEVRRQIDEIHQERERLRQERERIASGSVAMSRNEIPAPVVAIDAGSVPPAIPEEVATPEPDVAPPAPGLATGDAGQRAKDIAAAPVVAKVTEWVDTKDLGTFATVEILQAAGVKEGAIVCLRRNAGILGRFKLGEITPEGAIADPTTDFGEAKPQVGDELILEPAVK